MCVAWLGDTDKYKWHSASERAEFPASTNGEPLEAQPSARRPHKGDSIPDAQQQLCAPVDGVLLGVVRMLLARDLQDGRRFQREALNGWPDLRRDLRRTRTGWAPSSGVRFLTGPRRTYWLMRTMATSERDVKRLKASSICAGVVSADTRTDRDEEGWRLLCGVGADLSPRP